jgi:hypothetical protein
MINWILSPVMRWISMGLGILLAIGTIYGKGRRDARLKLEAKNNEDILKRTQDALAAGDSISRDPNRVREDDGYRRD